MFESKTPPKRLLSVGYINNVFLVIEHLESVNSVSDALEVVAKRLSRNRSLGRLVEPWEKRFRIMVSDENRLVSVQGDTKMRIRSEIERHTKLICSPRGGGTEYWVIRRQSGHAFFCKRLSKRSRTGKDLRKGELRPELAHLLCLLSEPRPEDIFLDPFAGSGAIPLARTNYPYNMIFAFDSDGENVRLIRSRIKEGKELIPRKSSPLIVGLQDARHLVRLQNGFIHKIVTDPPWGLYDTSLADLPSFYREVLGELCRVTKSGGLIVLLLGDRELAAQLSNQFRLELETCATYNVLVSGKKATVAKWRKR